MLAFEYVAREPKTGQKIRAEVQADNEQAAAKLIRQEGLAPIEIKVKSGGSSLFSFLTDRVSTKDRIIFSRELSTLINAGVPLIQAMRSVMSQTHNKHLKLVVGKIITDIEGGSTLSSAFSKYPKIFNQVYISMVMAGEASGTLDKSLERISLQQEKDAEVIAKVRGAMVYPAIVLLVMLGVVGFMLVKVLPQVGEIYKGFPSAKLPGLTVALLAVSHFVIKFWWLILIGLVVAGVMFTRYARTIAGRQVVDRAKMRMPPFGQLFMKLYMARFARTGATLIASGVPLLQMLQITADAINNVVVAGSLNRAIEKVKGGKALSDSLEGDQNFLELVPNMLRIGEQSGAIEQMLEKTAEYYEKEVDNQIKTISTIIEPVMMVILGVMAFIIVGAVLLPIYGLVGKTAR